MWYVYILLLNNWKYYIWSTKNIEKRILKHKNWWVLYTKPYRPIKLLYYRYYNSYTEARAVEMKIKKMKSKSYIIEFIKGPIV